MRCAYRVLLFACALSLTGCWEGISRDIVATVLSVRGEVLGSQDGATNFRPVSVETQLGRASIVRTSNDAQLDLALIPGALARVLGGSELRIQQLTIAKDGNETGDAIRDRVARIELSRGEIVILFEGFAKFTVITPQATINVLPSCLFRVDVDPERTRLTCVRGKLYVTAQAGRSTTVEGGFFCQWPSSESPTPVTQGEQAQTDTTTTLQVAGELQQLDAAQRDRLPLN